ncbi:MAG: T9SS type A sorting domain-containing protein [Bacteroidetes bacterium]|nr:T9SS type A sorting domain-containing protein [Bacteroidota bacterium]
MKIKLLFIGQILFLVLSVSSQPVTFYPHGIGGGGALFFPTINPGNEDEFYVSCDMSQSFHSTNFGMTYSQSDFRQLNVSSNSTFEFTNDGQTAYNISNDGSNEFPVKSTDNGSTWTAINAFDLNIYGSAYSIKANYNNPAQFIVGAYGQILISNDGGASFNIVKTANSLGAGLIVGGVFFDGNDIYIGTNDGLLHSSNGGSSFMVMPTTGITAGQVIWNFAGGKNGGTTRFTCIASDIGDTYNGIKPWDYYGFAKAVYTMDNANGTWVDRSSGINFSNDFIMYAAMSWNDANTIYLGGNDDANGAPLVLRSTTGGTNWSSVYQTINNANITTGWEGYQGDKNFGWSETCFGITAAPNNSSRVIFSNFSNVQISSDGGSNWRQAYVDHDDENPAGNPTPKHRAYHSIGLENTTSWQVLWTSPTNMLGAFSDIGLIRSTDMGWSWGYQYTGVAVNSIYRIEKGNSGTIYAACSNIHDMYQSTRLADAQLDGNDSNGKIVFSTDSGASWSDLYVFNHPVFWLAIDPNNQNRMYASVIHYGGTPGNQQGGIYWTNDLNNQQFSTWTKLTNPPRTEGHPASIVVLQDGKVVCTYSGRRNSGGTFTASSGVFIYNPVANSWTDVSDPGMLYWTKDIVIDPNDPSQNSWYVCVFSGWGGAPNGLGGLYKTTNRGSSWTKLTGSQFDRVTSISFDPDNLNKAYLTTEIQGLWYSEDMNSLVPTWTNVLSYPFRQPERVFFNPYDHTKIWVTSFGTGMKSGDLQEVIGVSEHSSKNKNDLIVYPNPVNGKFNLKYNSVVSTTAIIEICNAMGQVKFEKKINSNPGENKIMISMDEFEKGIYILTLKDDVGVKCARVIIE